MHTIGKTEDKKSTYTIGSVQLPLNLIIKKLWSFQHQGIFHKNERKNIYLIAGKFSPLHYYVTFDKAESVM
jgi:hypothetical protein